ncbi:hypothetical protein QJQ45_011837 [Haematococcus lacustris]|nr:hypothetical protein QJQ45_011837 [Haematococcus lacustris]
MEGPPIEPSAFDVIVVGSGLVEDLIASSLILAGRSVLLIDQSDVYGSGFASFTMAGLQGSCDPALNPNISRPVPQQQQEQQHQEQQQQQQQQEQCKHAAPQVDIPLTGCMLPLRNVRSIPPSCSSSSSSSSSNSRGYILDLAPKVLYQGEELVDLLIATRAHHYLEFKAVEASLILQAGVLKPVPASRSDIFRNKSLGLADKRQLMAFLAACLQAEQQGGGRLADPLQDNQALLATVLQRHGLSSQLAELVLYGIAMATWRQPEAGQHAVPPPPPPPLTPPLTPASPSPSPAPTPSSEAAGSPPCPPATPPPTQGALPTPPSQLLRAGRGRAALALLARSQGRFSSPSAFMTPSYGSGSLPEALVRHAAVHGAVTALRQPVLGLTLAGAGGEGGGEGGGQGERKGGIGGEGERKGGSGGGGERDKNGGGRQSGEGGGGSPPGSSGCRGGAGEAGWWGEVQLPSSASSASAGGEVEARQGAPALAASCHGGRAAVDGSSEGEGGCPGRVEAEGRRVTGLVLGTGQWLRCRQAVVLGAARLPRVVQEGAGLLRLTLSRALLVLDSPLLAAAAQALVVLPPSTPGLGNPHPIRGMQLSPSTLTCPPGRFLLYLSTPSSSGSGSSEEVAASDLQAAARLLAHLPSQGDSQPDTQPAPPEVQASGRAAEPPPVPPPHPSPQALLAPVAAAGEGAGPLNPTPPDPAASAAAPTAVAAAGVGSRAAGAMSKGGAVAPKPRALEVYFYQQDLAQPSGWLCTCDAPSHSSTAAECDSWGRRATEASMQQPPAESSDGRRADAEGPRQCGACGRTQWLSNKARGLPSNLVVCPDPDEGLVGYEAAVGEAKRLLACHFHGVRWLGDAGAPGGEAGDHPGDRADEDDDGAIEDLASALEGLRQTDGAGEQRSAQELLPQ